MNTEKVEQKNTDKQTESVMEFAIEGFTEKEAGEIRELFTRFLNKYKENPQRDMEEWLSEQIQTELPEKSEEETIRMAKEIKESIKEYDEDLESLTKSCKKGITKESWFADRLQDSAKGMSVNKFGNYLYGIDRGLEQSNQQMLKTILRNDGEINQCLNLDGFIAEQQQVNDFNNEAALKGSPYRASVCVPENGQYKKNSVDVEIHNVKTNQKGVERYQLKYGKDAKTTIEMIKRGDYRNQRLVVPTEQVEEVQQAFPNKTVTDHIGGSEKIDISSRPLSKMQIKQIQSGVQENGVFPTTDWNTYQTKELAINIGKNAGKAGISAAFMGMGMNLAKKVFSGEKIEADEVVKEAIETGSDTCVKAAAGGALKVASEKGAVSILPPGTPAGTLAKIACVGVENVKILWKVAKGDLTMSEAMEHMGRTRVSMYAGLSAGAIGTGIGAAALSWIPVVGPLVGGVVGGTVGYMAGSKFGEKIFNGAKKVVKKGVELVSKGVVVITNVLSSVKDTIFGWLGF